MITDFFAETKPAFVAVNGNGFTVNGKKSRQIEGFISEIIPVRKLFNGKKVECYSNDAVKGKNGQHCALCPKQRLCRKRIRLMMLLQDDAGEPFPAQLEINSNSFSNLQKMLEPIKENDLKKTLVTMEAKKQDKYVQILFSAVF